MTTNRFKKYVHKYYSDEGRYVGSNLKDIIKNLVIMFLLGVTIYLCFRSYSLGKRLSAYEPKINSTSVSVVTKTKKANSSKVVEQETKIQTTRDSFRKVQKYGQTIMPARILYWGSKDIKFGSNDPGFQSSDKAPSSKYKTNGKLPGNSGDKPFPGDYYFRDFTSTDLGAFGPTKDSLVQILFNRNNLRFTSYNKAANTYQSKDYPVDFERYRYNWTPDGLTSNKVRQFYIQPFISGKYGVLTKSISIKPGISFKTRLLDYNLGFSVNRDQRLNKNIYTDIELEVTYKFGKWLK